MIHPGPRSTERSRSRRADLLPVTGVLRAGHSVMRAVADLFAGQGCKGGTLSLAGAVCDPIRFVLPAPSSDGLHAAWYSDTRTPAGRWRIDSASASIGRKDGAPFLHCHGIWSDGENRAMGHLLPFDSILAEDCPVQGLGARSTWFEALPDPETAFNLLTPEGGDSGTGLFARLYPGEDVIPSIEALAAAHGIRQARLHGVGSIDHIRFDDGARMNCHATELRLNGARLVAGRAHIPIEVVDIHGHIAAGALARHGNPVGVTLELIIEPTEDIP